MTKDDRKASDILLDIELKIEQLINMVRAHDLNMKLISNKLNNLLNESSKTSFNGNLPRPSAMTDNGFSTHFSETFNTPESIKYNPEQALPIVEKPSGFRRTSRPDTYDAAGDSKSDLNKDTSIINEHMSSTIFNDLKDNTLAKDNKLEDEVVFQDYENLSKIPVIQRVVDRSGKSVFLAEVEIINPENGSTELKTRTNGVGKWQASLQPGKYKIKINKRESLTKEKIELIQTVVIDSKSGKQELPMVIVK